MIANAFYALALFIGCTILAAAVLLTFAFLPDLILVGWLAAVGLIVAWTYGASERRVRRNGLRRFDSLGRTRLGINQDGAARSTASGAMDTRR